MDGDTVGSARSDDLDERLPSVGRVVGNTLLLCDMPAQLRYRVATVEGRKRETGMTALKWWRGLTSREKFAWAYVLIAGIWSVYNLVEVCQGARWTFLIAPLMILIGAVLLLADLCNRRRRNQE